MGFYVVLPSLILADCAEGCTGFIVLHVPSAGSRASQVNHHFTLYGWTLLTVPKEDKVHAELRVPHVCHFGCLILL